VCITCALQLCRSIAVRRIFSGFLPQKVSRLRFLIMTDLTKQHAEKERALKKLIRKWLTAQETQGKAHALLARNPGIKKTGRTDKNS
jgi:hypothetical protein